MNIFIKIKLKKSHFKILRIKNILKSLYASIQREIIYIIFIYDLF